MIQNILAIFISLGIPITFHELGHFFTARCCGVSVLRFSVGFGKPILRFVAKTGTEYTLALIPLGGYVHMLDEREVNIPDAFKSQAFNNKSVCQRFVIVVAGPVANFILATVIYTIVALMGIQYLAPKVGEVIANSPISQTYIQPGDEIVAIDDTHVFSWESVNLVLIDLIGKSGTITVSYQNDTKGKQEDKITLEHWMSGKEPKDLINAFGLRPWQPEVIPTIAHVVKDGAAEKAGFKIGDKVVSVNKHPISQWGQFACLVQNHPGTKISVEIERADKRVDLSMIPQTIERDNIDMGYVGLDVVLPRLDKSLIRERHFGLFQSIIYGIYQTWDMVYLTVSSISKMFHGLISIDNLSGPITIAKAASASADIGLQSFLNLMAYLSVSLGVLNLLPVPVLDGGHLVFFSIEAIRRKPVSDRVRALAYRVGASLLFVLMAIAIFNDIARLR